MRQLSAAVPQLLLRAPDALAGWTAEDLALLVGALAAAVAGAPAAGAVAMDVLQALVCRGRAILGHP